MKTIFERVSEVEARFKNTSIPDDEKARFYASDVATLFEANQMLIAHSAQQTSDAKVFLARIEQLKADVERLTAECDRLRNREPADEETVADLQAQVRRAMMELIRRGINPGDAIRSGLPSTISIDTGGGDVRPPFKPRVVK